MRCCTAVNFGRKRGEIRALPTSAALGCVLEQPSLHILTASRCIRLACTQRTFTQRKRERTNRFQYSLNHAQTSTDSLPLTIARIPQCGRCTSRRTTHKPDSKHLTKIPPQTTNLSFLPFRMVQSICQNSRVNSLLRGAHGLRNRSGDPT
jgi:hypothetical protein